MYRFLFNRGQVYLYFSSPNLSDKLHIVLRDQPRGTFHLAQEPARELSAVDPHHVALPETELALVLRIKVVQSTGLPLCKILVIVLMCIVVLLFVFFYFLLLLLDVRFLVLGLRWVLSKVIWVCFWIGKVAHSDDYN